MSCKENAMKLLILNAGCSMAFYMTIAVLALYINQFLSIGKTAIIMAIPSIFRLFSGILMPCIDRKIALKKLGVIAVMLNAVVYMMYPMAKSFVVFIVLASVNGLAELIYQPTIKYMFSNLAQNDIETDYVHKIRYYSICIAGLLGPIIGGGIESFCGAKTCFLFASAIELLMVLLFIVFIPDAQNLCIIDKTQKRTSKVDKILIGYIASGFLVYFVFSQFESVYSLALKNYFENTELIYSILLCFNSFFGLLIQTILIKNNTKTNVCKGIVWFEIAFIIFAISFGLSLGILFYIIGVLVYTMAEVTVIPGLDIQIDECADENNKMEYFAIAEIRTMGFVIGPIVFGWALDRFNAVTTCIMSVCILALAQLSNEITVKMKTYKESEK